MKDGICKFFKINSYDNSAIKIVTKVDIVKVDDSSFITVFNSFRILLHVLFWIQFSVLQNSFNSIHVVFNVCHKLDNPGKINGDE